ncbi:hypothetical protein EDB84DRAFT_1562601 [Lactarius hengduanensis]|nr:hypothetical protein EDB84DRAFT_1562601 [Lactarius hengduanensis]
MSPGFFGLFSKRGSSKSLRKASTPDSPRPRPKSPAGIPPTSTAKDNTSPSIADNSETLEGSQLSLDTDYVLADADSPPPLPAKAAYPIASSSSASGASSSTTKLKMPFRRKQSTSSKLSTTTTQSSVPPVPPAKELHKFSIDSSLSDSPSLHPPPSRSVIFGSYADPHNTLSTRSLPQDSPFTHSRQDSADTARNYETMSNPDSHMPSYSPLHPPKLSSKGGLFAWARPRGRTKSKPSVPAPPSLQPQSSSTLPPPADSFNLKSFRHVTPSLSTSPNPDSPPLDSLDPPVRPRPRGDSFASDSSQRISVAAFREVQARRSATNSPVPSLPGDRDSGVASGQVRSHKRSSTIGTPPPLPNTGSQPRLPVARSPPTRSSTAPLFLSAGMTSSESSEEEDSGSDDEEEATLRPNRKRTVTSRSTGGTQSELGHRTSPVAALSSARSDVGHGVHSASPSRLAVPSSQHSPSLDAPGESSRASSVYSRTRASVSASALVPEAAVNRASMISKQSVASKLTETTRTQSRASTSSEEESSSSSSQSSSEDAPLASLIPPPRPGSAMSRASGSPGRRPTKPLIDIGELVGGNNAPPIRTPEQSKDSSQASKEDSPLLRPRKASFGIGERLSALTSGISGSQPSRPKSPESASDSKDEAFTPPAVPEKPRPQSPALPTRTSPPPRSQTKSASPALMPKGTKSSPGGIRLKSSGGFKIDTSPLKLDSTYSPPPSSSASSDAPIPHITPTPIRERQEPPAFTVTSRPTSHATNLSVGTLAALDNAIAETNDKQGPRAAASATADQARRNQQRQPQQQQDPQTTVRVVRSVPPKPSREESLPVPRPQQRPRVASASVTVSNIRVTPPPSSASSAPSVPRYGASGGSMVPLPKPFALRDSSPASSAGESSSSRMPATPRDGSELGVGRSGRPGRPGPDHRKRASVTFLDQVAGNERDARRSNIAPRQSHGPVVAADSSDEEVSLRNRERQAEEKRKERRRGEAKAAIELGKVINGTGPIDDDDDDNNGEDDEDDDRPMNVPPRMSMAMGMGMSRNVPFPSAPMGFQGQWPASASAPQPFANQFSSQSMQNLLGASAGAGMNMAAGMNMNPNMNMGGGGMGMVDPRMLMAHQQAMMIAKQTYQLAVAQQAMRDAADEWERGSAVSGWGGSGGGRSSIAAPSVLGMGMNMGMNMNGNLGVGPFGMPPGAWPAGGGGSAARSMYAGSVYAASEIGVPSGGGAMGWSTTNSVYGESFGAPRDRSSRAFRQGPGQQQHGPGGAQARESGGGTSGAAKREGARQRTRTAPSSGGGQQLRASAGAGGGAGAKRRGEAPALLGAVSPPSSWKGAS